MIIILRSPRGDFAEVQFIADGLRADHFDDNILRQTEFVAKSHLANTLLKSHCPRVRVDTGLSLSLGVRPLLRPIVTPEPPSATGDCSDHAGVTSLFFSLSAPSAAVRQPGKITVQHGFNF